MALGKALTRREETRREGIALLEPMASGNKEADSGLRQALLWLGPQAGDEQYYDTWMQRHPRTAKFRITFANGAAVRRAARATPISTAAIPPPRSSSLKRFYRPTPDADALAGMGYIAQRSGDYRAASQYLSRAADLGGDASATRRQQAADALFYGQLAQAQQAYKQGNISRRWRSPRRWRSRAGAGRLGEAVPRRCAAAQQRFAPGGANAALTVK
nr:Uncharacterised protein [Klebsiella pneumoniae]